MTAATLETDQGGAAPEFGARRRHSVVPTPLGDLTLVAEDEALVGVYFPDHRPAPDRAGFGETVDVAQDALLHEVAEQLAAVVAGRREGFDLPLRPVGSERARQVWERVAAVPRGETTTYAALGRAVGVGPRAAGQFVARNPLCLVVPCHRVVASDGRLTGYAGGVDVKRRLLELEGVLEAGGAAVRVPVSAGSRTAAVEGQDVSEGAVSSTAAEAPAPGADEGAR